MGLHFTENALMWPFTRRSEQAQAVTPPIALVEGLSGTWFYHLARTESPREALCGNTHIMSSPGILKNWGYRGHLNERYCKTCEEKAREAGWGNLLGS